MRQKFSFVVNILVEKYGFDRFNDWFFAGGARALGGGLWKGGDVAMIDGVMVNGSARVVGWIARRGAPVPVRLHLPVRVHHDHRRLRAADAVVRARLGDGR